MFFSQVMLAIKRMKDIKCGKKFSSSTAAPVPPQEIVAMPRDSDPLSHAIGDFRTFSGGSRDACVFGRQQSHAGAGGSQPYNATGAQFSPSLYHRTAQHPHHHHHQQQQQQQQQSPLHRQHNPSNSINSNNNVNNSSNNGSNSNSQQHHQSINSYGVHASHPPPPASVQYRPDIVTVQVHPQVRRSKDGVFEEPIYSTFHPENNRYSQYQQQFVQLQQQQQLQQSNQFSSLPTRPNLPPLNNSYTPRSLDDGDITPTNEVNCYEGGGGTLPRHKAANTKYRPVAKVTAKTRVDVHHEMSHNEHRPLTNGNTTTTTTTEGKDKIDACKQLPNSTKIENIYNMIHSHSTNNTPHGTPKKLPPPPPRRSNSISETSKQESLSPCPGKGSSATAPSSHTRDSQYGFLRRSLNYGYMGVKNNLQPDIASDLPPPPPAPHDVGNHQHIHHHHSHRRPQQQLLKEEDLSTSDSKHEEVEQDFPSPPPSALAAQSEQTQDEAALVRPRRNDSTVSNCSHKVRDSFRIGVTWTQSGQVRNVLIFYTLYNTYSI